METFKRILIPTDGSPGAAYAVEKGLGLAKLIGATKIIALYVKDLARLNHIPESDMTMLINTVIDREGEEILREVETEAGKRGLKVELVVLDGHPADVILDVAEEQDIDIIVMGTVGRSGINRLLMGSVAEKVTRHAPCPVLVIRYKTKEE